MYIEYDLFCWLTVTVFIGMAATYLIHSVYVCSMFYETKCIFFVYFSTLCMLIPKIISLCLSAEWLKPSYYVSQSYSPAKCTCSTSDNFSDITCIRYLLKCCWESTLYRLKRDIFLRKKTDSLRSDDFQILFICFMFNFWYFPLDACRIFVHCTVQHQL